MPRVAVSKNLTERSVVIEEMLIRVMNKLKQTIIVTRINEEAYKIEILHRRYIENENGKSCYQKKIDNCNNNLDHINSIKKELITDLKNLKACDGVPLSDDELKNAISKIDPNTYAIINRILWDIFFIKKVDFENITEEDKTYIIGLFSKLLGENINLTTVYKNFSEIPEDEKEKYKDQSLKIDNYFYELRDLLEKIEKEINELKEKIKNVHNIVVNCSEIMI